MSAQATAPVLHHGIVKQVQSGDAVVVRGQPKGGPPPERTVCLSNIVAPKLARRSNPNAPNSVETKDEPYAWEAREFLRNKLVGKEVCFIVEYKAPGADREYGIVYIGKDTTAENVTESLVKEGLVEVRRLGIKSSDEQTKLIEMEDVAKAAGKGKWAEGTGSEHMRNIKWTLDNPRNFVDSHHGKPVEAVIEYVRDGCTMRVFILPSNHYATIMLSGVKCPMYKLEDGKQVPEPFAEETRYFVESRLNAKRNVEVVLEGVSNQNLLGTILHPNGNITELLLKEGFARCVDWSMGVVTQGPEKLRAAEKSAKERRARIWKDYVPSTLGVNISEKEFTAKVMEVVNGDALVLKMASGESKKVFLASIRPPRQQADAGGGDGENRRVRVRPLYDVPYMFEAREFLRKKLIGKKVNVTVDYIQPASDSFPEKNCCTVMIGSINVGEALVSKGLGTVIRYRQDDDQRSSQYTCCWPRRAAPSERQAVCACPKKEVPLHRVADISGDLSKAKQFLPFCQRGSSDAEAIVELCAGRARRLRCFIPRETCLFTFLLAGISCPRGSRPAPSGGTPVEAEPYGNEALQFTKEMVLQREGAFCLAVDVEVESMDKAGNFIGWMFVDGVNLSLSLVEDGLASVHFTAERSQYFKQLQTAETNAKEKKLNMWTNYVEAEEIQEPLEEELERKLNFKSVCITDVGDDLHFYAQHVDSGPQLSQLMEQLRKDMEENPPITSAYKPKKGEVCAARFSVDNEWYRGRVEKVIGNKAAIFYSDYGNRENVPSSCLAPLPAQYKTLAPQAHEYGLACVTVPADADARADAREAFAEDAANHQFCLNTEYKVGNLEYVTLLRVDTDEDVAITLLDEGLVYVEPRREKRLQKLLTQYNKSQQEAKTQRINLWRYGDITEDDAKEFGFNG
ncbi:PREDICTED: LOW QUALITY PROTEIN: staphylococcal nuclease domain-containing protein 1-like [Priapulus caudatus]|uniref:Staphylococcal nuclease domain-containing protein 1 n=1 Tax=Priapulus caudatus TaxID=37621 RepID=A0ABM1DXL9_PRICU|nr:PREDICTED: LOW QUALITY PROTEIN: staphylococcal nuclease domain-containing protein 1-like [Priapulus caudatus]